MTVIDDYIAVSQLSTVKDYTKLEGGPGFVVSDSTSATAAIHTEEPAEFIALLEFLPSHPRGNHYHLRKVEYMVALSGRLECQFMLADDEYATAKRIVLGSGQMVRILPGCVHTFTALDDRVLALEYSPQPFTAEDVYTI